MTDSRHFPEQILIVERQRAGFSELEVRWDYEEGEAHRKVGSKEC